MEADAPLDQRNVRAIDMSGLVQMKRLEQQRNLKIFGSEDGNKSKSKSLLLNQ
jgi:hypothetical protein